MVEILDDRPGGLPDFIAGENHVDAGFDGVLDFDGQNPRVTVQILSLTLKTVKTVGVLDVKRRNGSHVELLLLLLLSCG